MRILLITSEEWNDYVYANGVLTNWFTDYDAEFAQIYCSPGLPCNDICSRYFQLTDSQMARSILGGTKAGRKLDQVEHVAQNPSIKENARRKGVYGLFKKTSLYFNSFVLILRDLIWMMGRINESAIQEFVEQYQPDVVFCPRKVSPKQIRIEKIVAKYTDAPFVAFTGDDEASVSGHSFSPLFWLRKFYLNRMFKKHVPVYSHYLMHSEDQAHEYAEKYGLRTSIIFKCGNFNEKFEIKTHHTPIRMVYAGRLYCNRWKSLAAIGEALHEINADGEKMVLDIYTQETLTDVQKHALCKENHVFVKGAVPGSELPRIYKEADIALHVESFDKVNRELTRVSFSTKIIDLMASTCAIMAICWEKHAGFQYLRKHDAAFCISKVNEIKNCLEQILADKSLIQSYAKKAFECGTANHSRSFVQQKLNDVFVNVINNKK